MNIHIETFGCTFNQADSQIMMGLLQENGVKLVDDPGDADVIIINTCYVKYPTEQKMINHIKRIQSDYPMVKLLITGCMVEIDPEMLEKNACDAGWLGPHQINHAMEAVNNVLNGERVRLTGPNSNLVKVGLPKTRFNPFIDVIQICEGCTGKCSYCCTRFARGGLQSYPLDSIIAEASKAVREGCVELQLTAQDTAAYGRDINESLSSLINGVTRVPGDYRVRVGMMHPKNIINNLDNVIESYHNEKVYNFLHLPIQSGNDDVLRDMNREYSVEEFKYIVNRFRMSIPTISIATDVIVGYPSEDDEAFHDTLKLVGEIEPDFLHISKYHHRPGTASSQLVEIDHSIMKERSRALNEVKTGISLRNNLKLIGSVEKILVTDEGGKGGFIGRTGNYKTVVVDDAPIGCFMNVEIVEAKSTYLKGIIL